MRTTRRLARSRRQRKVKPMKAAAKHRDYAPHHLTMKMPALEEVGDQLNCKVLFEGVGSTAIGLELNEDVLVYLTVEDSAVQGFKLACRNNPCLRACCSESHVVCFLSSTCQVMQDELVASACL